MKLTLHIREQQFEMKSWKEVEDKRKALEGLGVHVFNIYSEKDPVKK